MFSGLVLLDNTVLTNFALIGRSELVLNLWGANCATTTAVIAEYDVGVAGRKLPAHLWQNLKQLTLSSDERATAALMSPRLGAGERTCIASAVHRQGLLVTDDADARAEAQRRNVPITGTVGILVLNVRRGNLTLSEGNMLLSDMIAQGYRSPVSALDALI